MIVPPWATTLNRMASCDLAMLPRLNCTRPNVRAPTVAAQPALGDPGGQIQCEVSHQPLDPQFTCWQAVLCATLFQLPALQIF